MADSKISALAAAAAAAGANEIPINEAGATKKVTVAQILTADTHASYSAYAAIADPAAPAASTLRTYAKDIASRIMPKWIGPSGVDTPYQPFVGFNGVRQIAPGGGATAGAVFQAFGVGSTAAGTTFANAAIATGSLLSRTNRATVATSTTAGTLANVRMQGMQCSLETGFFFVCRFFLAGTIQTGQRTFYGLQDSSGAATNIDPLADTTRAKLGVGHNVATGNWFLITNTGGSVPTTTDFGASYPLDITSLYEFCMFNAPGGTTVGYRMSNLSTAAVTSGTIAANLPGSTVMLDFNSWTCNNATAAISTFGITKVYLETDN